MYTGENVPISQMHRDPTAAGKMGKAANQSTPPLKPEPRWSVRRFDSKASARSPPTNEEDACAQMMKVWLPLNIEVFVDERVEKEQVDAPALTYISCADVTSRNVLPLTSV